MSDDTAQRPSRARLPHSHEGGWYDDEPITEQQLAAMTTSVEDGELPSYSRFVVRKLLAEVKRLRDLNAELSETLDVRHDETQQLRAKLATRGDLMSGLDAEVDRLAGDNAKLRARLAEIGELGRLEREIGIWQTGDDDAQQYCGFSEADVKARAAEQGAVFVERDCRRSKWREVPDA